MISYITKDLTTLLQTWFFPFWDKFPFWESCPFSVTVYLLKRVYGCTKVNTFPIWENTPPGGKCTDLNTQVWGMGGIVTLRVFAYRARLYTQSQILPNYKCIHK